MRKNTKKLLAGGVALIGITGMALRVLGEPLGDTLLILLLVAMVSLLLLRVSKLPASIAKAQAAQDRRLIPVLDRLDARGRRLEPIIRDTAGSVGRMAPLVREVRKAADDLSHAATASHAQATAQAPQLPKPPPKKQPEFPIPPALRPEAELEVRNPNIKALVIADPFTATALNFEWTQFSPTPQDWPTVLQTEAIDLLFVESAWEGNHGSWRYHLTGQSAPRPALIELVEACKKRGIPTVFWNKEDPPHYEDFLPTAKLFDWVYTTEVGLLDSYRNALGHDRVAVLPFAAAPDAHNPARIDKLLREKGTVFGGMYFRHKYPERREQMDYLLPAAAEYGLDIFSRQEGLDEKYRFPTELQKHVVGKLPYPMMVGAYHAYKVVLNVNSVPASNSMVARRIFEATACGAAVVSPQTPAISNYFEDDVISQVSDLSEAKHTVRSLLRSDEYRERLVHLAQRQIWAEHTYNHRVQRVLTDLGIGPRPTPQTTSFIVGTFRPQHLETIFRNFARQAIPAGELVLLTHGFAPDMAEIARLRELYGVGDFSLLEADAGDPLGRNLNRLIEASSGGFIVRMDDDDWYGANYTLDLMNAAMYSRADLVGKAASYIYFERMNATILTYAAHENRYTDFVRGATFAGPASTFRSVRFPEIPKSEDSGFIRSLEQAGGRVYSADRFNFVVRRAADTARHTWTVSDRALFSSGTMKFTGDGIAQVSL